MERRLADRLRLCRRHALADLGLRRPARAGWGCRRDPGPARARLRLPPGAALDPERPDPRLAHRPVGLPARRHGRLHRHGQERAGQPGGLRALRDRAPGRHAPGAASPQRHLPQGGGRLGRERGGVEQRLGAGPRRARGRADRHDGRR